MFQQILAIFWQQNPLKKIDSFSDVSPDFWHFSSDKTHWKNWLFSDVSTDLAIFMATNPIEEIDSVSDVSTDFGHFFWRQNPLTRSVPATRILVVKEVFGLFSRLQLWTFFCLRKNVKIQLFLIDLSLTVPKRSVTFSCAKRSVTFSCNQYWRIESVSKFWKFWVKIDDFRKIACQWTC